MENGRKKAKEGALIAIISKAGEWSKDKMKKKKKKDIEHDNKDLAYDIEKKDEAYKKGDVAEAEHYDRDEMYKSKGRDYDKKEMSNDEKKKKLKDMMKK